MRIVQEEPQYGATIADFRLSGIGVENMSTCRTFASASRHLQLDSEDFVFDEPFSGKAYLTYPFEVVVEIDINLAPKLSAIFFAIAKAYASIYEEEAKTAETPVLDESDRGMCLNRNATNGKYGIWGHDLGDLVFERLTIHEGGLITVGIGS